MKLKLIYLVSVYTVDSIMSVQLYKNVHIVHRSP